MKFAELQGKGKDELKEMALGLKKELFNLRFQQATGELANAARFKQVRRDIARIKTAMNLTDDARAKQASKPTKAPKAPKAKKAETKTTLKKTTRTKAKKEA